MMSNHPEWFTGAPKFLEALEHYGEKVWYGGWLGTSHTIALALSPDRSQLVAAFICRPKD